MNMITACMQPAYISPTTHTHTHTHTLQSWAYWDLGGKKRVVVFQTKRWTILANTSVAAQMWVRCLLQRNLNLPWLSHTLPLLYCTPPWCEKNSFPSLIYLFSRPHSPSSAASGQRGHQVHPEWSQHYVSWPHLTWCKNGHPRPWKHQCCILKYIDTICVLYH